MNLTSLSKCLFCLVFSISAMAGMAQATQPFVGAWHTRGMFLNIDFYEQNIPVPGDSTGRLCPGFFKLAPNQGALPHLLEDVHINGNQATAMALLNGQATPLTFDSKGSGLLTLSLPAFTATDPNGEEVTYPATTYTLRRAWPFIGDWQLKNGNGSMQLNLYDKCFTATDSAGNRLECYGTITFPTPQDDSTQTTPCLIVTRRLSGNKAVIEFGAPQTGAKYRTILTYLPATKQLKASVPELMEQPADEDAHAPLSIPEDLTFVRKP